MGASEEGLVYWPFWVYLGSVVVLIVGMVGLSFILGQRRGTPVTATPYESGIVTTGSARARFSINFYLTAVFFVIFDIESVFIFSWAVSAREVGWMGYAGLSFFVVMLLASLVYLWGVGGLDYVQRTRGLRETP